MQMNAIERAIEEEARKAVSEELQTRTSESSSADKCWPRARRKSV
jgi:hypothetical protein